MRESAKIHNHRPILVHFFALFPVQKDGFLLEKYQSSQLAVGAWEINSEAKGSYTYE